LTDFAGLSSGDSFQGFL